ncbi:hypothetical protein D3C74_480660 [compost metagenome]
MNNRVPYSHYRSRSALTFNFESIGFAVSESDAGLHIQNPIAAARTSRQGLFYFCSLTGIPADGGKTLLQNREPFRCYPCPIIANR